MRFFNTLNKPYIIFAISSLLFALVDRVLTEDLKFETCVPANCGKGPNISYPFWISDHQESYCGHPNFEITCSDEYSILNISGDDYMIKNISYDNNSVLLANVMLYDSENTCPIPLHNFSLSNTPFVDSFSYTDLYFLYNCSSYPSDPTYSIECDTNSTRVSFAVFHLEILEHENYSIGSCQSLVQVPVTGENIDNLLALNFTSVLRKGFDLEWNETNCSSCKSSGGRCGFDNNEFICFCSDKPHSRTCNGKSHVKRNIGIAFAALVGALLIAGLALLLYRKKRAKTVISSWESRDISSYGSSMLDLEKSSSYYGVQVFEYNDLQEATNNFDENKELGDGGFGVVYQGKLRDGRVVAVKRLYERSFKRAEQFKNEVEILAKLRHRNLVTLYGCTSRSSRELLLVYEYVSNGTVADHLHGEQAKPGSLSWTTRMSIAVETADALLFLHKSDVIHRDVKTNNILLDGNFVVKVADFGLSRLYPNNVTHVSTAPQGTPGYVDPEYHQCYRLTNKSDVYSFGVVLIELISSMPAVDITRHRHYINLANMAIDKIQNHALSEIVDPYLGFDSDFKVKKMINGVAELAFQCLQDGKDMRPTMEEAFEILKTISSEDYCAIIEEMEISGDGIELLKSEPPAVSSGSTSSNCTTPVTSG